MVSEQSCHINHPLSLAFVQPIKMVYSFLENICGWRLDIAFCVVDLPTWLIGSKTFSGLVLKYDHGSIYMYLVALHLT